MRGSTKPTSAAHGSAARSWSEPRCVALICVARICAWQSSIGQTCPTPICTTPRASHRLSLIWRATVAELSCRMASGEQKMPKDEHVAVLLRGAAVWNAWRAEHDEVPDLSRAALRGVDLTGFDLSLADLRGADLRGTN